MRNPARTIKIAGPLAVAVVAALYIFSNIAYLASASKEEIMNSGRLVVALLMKNIWGEKVERWVDFGVACSALGSVLAMVCNISSIGGRALLIIHSLSLKDVLIKNSEKREFCPLVNFGLPTSLSMPLWQVLAYVSVSIKHQSADTDLSLKPDWFFCVLVIFFVPAGDAYNLVINLVRVLVNPVRFQCFTIKNAGIIPTCGNQCCYLIRTHIPFLCSVLPESGTQSLPLASSFNRNSTRYRLLRNRKCIFVPCTFGETSSRGGTL